MHDVFPDWQTEITAIRDFGEVLVIESRAAGTGRGSTVALGQRLWQAAGVKDGKIVWWKFVRTEDEALEAAGLSE